MFRINHLIQITKPLVSIFYSYLKHPTLIYSSRMWFSDKSKQKIYQLMEKGNLQKNLDKIMTDIASLSEEVKEEVLEALIQKVFEKNLPPRIILEERLNAQLKKHPHLHFEAYYFRAIQSINKLDQYINGDDKKIQMVIAREISDSFVICFEDLKKMQAKIAAPKQIQLLRSFAHYNFYYLSKLVDPKKQFECINKSRQCYKVTLVKSTALLKSLLKDEKQLINRANPHQTLQQKESREDDLQQLDGLKFQLVEEYAQTVSEMLTIENELFVRKQKLIQLKEQNQNNTIQIKKQQFQFQMSKETLWLEPAIDKALKNYQKISHRFMQSKFYFQLRKIHLQVKKQMKLRELVASIKNPEERTQEIQKVSQQAKEKMDNLYQGALEEMKKFESLQLDAEIFAAHVMFLLKVKFEHFINRQVPGGQLDKKKMGEEVQKLVNSILDQNKKRMTLGLVIQKIKDTFNIKIDSYVQKVPRNLRTQRRRRLQAEEEI